MNLARAIWRKSTHSCVNGCVEVSFAGDFVAVRDSKNRNGAVLTFSLSEWTAFTKGVRGGEFDPPDKRFTHS